MLFLDTTSNVRFQSISEFILSMMSCNLSSEAVHALCSGSNVANL